MAGPTPLLVFLRQNLFAVPCLCLLNVVYALGAFYVFFKVSRVIRRRMKTTALHGPPNPSFLFGLGKTIILSSDPGQLYEKWAEEYGGVYEIPFAPGEKRIVLCDPKAIAHLYGREPWTYVLTPFLKIATENFVGKGILTAMGECHRRQRKALTPAFSNSAIRNLASVFYDSAYKTKGCWDSLIEANGGSTVVDVQNWMNRISLDTIGIAGFSHDFGTLDGKPTPVTEVFDTLGSVDPAQIVDLLVLSQAFPLLLRFPVSYLTLVKKLNDTMGDISNALLTKSRKERAAGTVGEGEEKSILGLLIKAESQGGQLYLTPEEVTGEAKVLLLAGYETTSISLTWALIELSKNPEAQTKLRDELLELGADPTYDQLPCNLPYLDAIVHETFRMHPSLPEFATVDDVIPLSKPVRTRSGELIDHISVAKGTHLCISIPSINCSTALWGTDAKEFKPERWIRKEGIPIRAREVQGHRHLLTFIDGPRACLGKGFAIAQMKIVLAVLVKNFAFELRDGPGTALAGTMGILPRPKVVGEQGTAVPLRVRRLE